MNLLELTSFFGWCTLINIGIMLFSALMLITCKNFVIAYYTKLFDLDLSQVMGLCFQYLAQYKIAVLVLNLVPYITLKILS